MTICGWFHITGGVNNPACIGKRNCSDSITDSSWSLQGPNFFGRPITLVYDTADAIGSVCETWHRMEQNKWYHIGLVLDGVNCTAKLRVWDDSAEEVHSGTSELWRPSVIAGGDAFQIFGHPDQYGSGYGSQGITMKLSFLPTSFTMETLIISAKVFMMAPVQPT